jgi:cytochrome c peroxidase
MNGLKSSILAAPFWNRSWVVLLCLPLLFVACADEEQGIDAALKSALNHASEGQGLAYYLLPDPADLSNIPQDPLNPLTPEKVALGKLLYHETAMATRPMKVKGTYTYSCASCHHARAGFQACLPQGIAEGGLGFGSAGESRVKDVLYENNEVDVQPIRSPSILNIAFQEVVLWNGQFGATGPNAGTENQWASGTPIETNYLGFQGTETQAIAGLGVHRLHMDADYANTYIYQQLFKNAFPGYPEEERYGKVNVGLAIAAYERTVVADQAPFQRWLKGEVQAMTESQKNGALLFFGKAECYKCHNGPALNDMDFHALGMKDLDDAVSLIEIDEKTKKGRGGFTDQASDWYQFKTPQLYSLRYSPFYGHGASFESVRAVIEYKNRAVKENPDVPDQYLDELFYPLHLTQMEIDQLTDFVLHALDDPNLQRYEPASVPSGHCIPNNDSDAKFDLGCG